MREFSNHCVKSNKVLGAMEEEITAYEANQQLKKQVRESKRLVADQLQGVSEVMEDFAQEILKERQYHEEQELEIDRKSTRLNSSHVAISYAVFCLKKTRRLYRQAQHRTAGD